MIAGVLAIAGVLTVIATLIVVTRMVERRFAFAPEYARKALHVGSGAVAMAFPWVFDHAWQAVVTCALGAVALWLARRNRRVGREVVAVLGGAGRASAGAYYLPAAIASLFVLSNGDLLLYEIPLLVVTLADPAAALAGSRSGTTCYRTATGVKSVEGSLSFALVASAVVTIPLLVTTSIGVTASILTGLLVATLSMVAEALGSRGEDNLTVPLVAFLTLKTLAGGGLPDLGGIIVVLLTLSLFAALVRRRRAPGGAS